MSPTRAKNSQILPYFQSHHSAVAPSVGVDTKLNKGAHLPLSNQIEIISEFKRINGDVAFLIFVVRKRGRQTNKKHLTLSPPRQCTKS